MVDKSFSLIRTNPALTTNVKLVVDSNLNLYLESYKVNKNLSQERFSRFKIKHEDLLSEQIPYFFLDVPEEVAYEVRNLNDQDIMYDQFEQQIDDTYFAGAKWTQDTSYDEEYEYTAPLWVKPGKYPAAFVVLRVDGSGIEDTNQPENFRAEFINRWKLVKWFDMSEKSALGQFIRKNFEQSFFPSSPMDLNFVDGAMSSINGVDYNNTGFVKKSFDLERIKKLNTPIFKTEEQFTSYYKENGVIFPNIVNFNFLFDDNPSTETETKPWSINRYVGFYLDQIELIQKFSSYEPYALNKTDITLLEQLNAEQVNEIPYVSKNCFVRNVQGRMNSFDPIQGGWDPIRNYWIEWQGEFFQLERVPNTRIDVFGKWLYRIISDRLLEHEVPTAILESQNQQLIQQYQKILINEFSTGKNRIEIVAQMNFDDVIARNVIQAQTNLIPQLRRNFVQYLPTWSSGSNPIWGFEIYLEADNDNNNFQIENFEQADFHYIELFDQKFLVKRYDPEIPNLGGLYYIDSDWSIEINSQTAQFWRNNGNITKDVEDWHEYSIQQNQDQVPITFNLSRASFLDIKDFDFQRTETDYARYEYDRDDQILETLEPKLYHPDRRQRTIKVWKPRQITSNNFNNKTLKEFLSSELETYLEWYNRATKPITYNNGIQYFDTFEEYVQFKLDKILNYQTYFIDGNEFKRNMNWYRARLPLYVYPTRIPILRSDGTQARDLNTGDLLWQLDYTNNDWKFTQTSQMQLQNVDLNPEYYREEGYLLIIDDSEIVAPIDFLTNSTRLEIKPILQWNANYPMPINMIWDTTIQPSPDPNLQFDPNYVPVSTEYATSEELFELRSGALTPLWHKNQWVSKWGYMNSISTHDYPYRLGFDLEVNGLHNHAPHPSNNLEIPMQQFRDLEYFYRFGMPTDYNQLDFYSLHLKESFFNIDAYLSTQGDYFDWLFNSDIATRNGLRLTQKWSAFNQVQASLPASTVFRGVKWKLQEIEDKIVSVQGPTTIIEDFEFIQNQKFQDYRFSVVLGRKLSIFNDNNGDGDGDLGVDIYLNDYWKNCVVFIYFETDELVTFGKINDAVRENINLETCHIDDLYVADQQIVEATDPAYWDLGQLRVNGIQEIGNLRIRDLKLVNLLQIISDPNYDPENGSGRRRTNFIHVYEDGSYQIMDSDTTDFWLEGEIADSFLIREQSFTVQTEHQNLLDINNSIKNRIILDDDPNNPDGNHEFTQVGARVNSLVELNVWDGEPVSRKFTYISPKNGKPIWDLNEEEDPVVWRFSGPYAPIFRKVELFRPNSWWQKVNNATFELDFGLGTGNWKFYDNLIFEDPNAPNLYRFGWIDELLVNKVNRKGNILQLSNDSNNQLPAVYPMVDEFGLTWVSRWIFKSSWANDFYVENRRIELPKNEYPGLAGYAIYLNGENDRLVIQDQAKFNMVPLNYAALEIDPSEDIDLSGETFTFRLALQDLDLDQELNFKLVDATSKTEKEYHWSLASNWSGIPDDFIKDIELDGTDIIIWSDRQLGYEFLENSDLNNENGGNWLINFESGTNSETVYPQRSFNADLSMKNISMQITSNILAEPLQFQMQIPQNSLGQYQFSAPQFEDNANSILGPEYRIMPGSIQKLNNNLKFRISSVNPGAEYNFQAQNLKNIVEATSEQIQAPRQENIVEKARTENLQYLNGAQGIRSLTVEFWFRVAQFTKENQTLLFKGDEANASDWSWKIYRNGYNGQLCFATRSWMLGETPQGEDDEDLNTISINHPIHTDVMTTASRVDDGLWHHIAVTLNHETRTKSIILDGKQESQRTNDFFTNIITDYGNLNSKNWPIIVGASGVNGLHNFQGNIDELRIWNFARSLAEIQQNHRLLLDPNAYLDPKRMLLGYWKFDEQSGTPQIADWSKTLNNVKRVNKIRKISTNTGDEVIDEISHSYQQFEVDQHASANIRTQNQDLTFEVSGADIVGVADERYQPSLPPTTTKKQIKALPNKARRISKYVIQFQKPTEPKVMTPPAQGVPTLNPVKVVDVSNTPNFVVQKDQRLNKLNLAWLKEKAQQTLKLQVNKIDQLNRRRKYLAQSENPDDQFQLAERIRTIQRNPLGVVQRESMINQNPEKKKVTLEKNKTGLVSQIKNLFRR